jgi:hypothetical protein
MLHRKPGWWGAEGDTGGQGMEMHDVRTGIPRRSDERRWVRRGQRRQVLIIMRCLATEASGKT